MRGSRENPDLFTDNRAPKAQESRGVRGHAPLEKFFNFNCLKCPLLASGVNHTIYLQTAFFLDSIRRKTSNKKGQNYFRDSTCSLYNVDLFIYSFYILKFLTVSRKTVENCVDPRQWVYCRELFGGFLIKLDRKIA